MNNEIYEKLVNESDVIMLDTCFAMSDEFPAFIETIEIEFMAHKKKIIVKSCVMAELYRKMGVNEEKVRYKATRAVEIICMKTNIFERADERVTAEEILKAFADAEFISEFAKNRIEYKMTLLTNDYKLGKDIKDLNKLKSCYGKNINVFALNKEGYLEEREYDVEVVNVNDLFVEGNCETTDEKDNKKRNVAPILAIVVTSFVTGAVMDRYGKKILDTVLKAVA